MVFSGDCENFSNDSSGLPSIESSTPGTKLYGFVSNPNVRLDENGDYIINFDDPDFISNDEYEGYQEERDPDTPSLVIRVNFHNRTAFVQIGEMAVDQSRKYFPIEGDTP